MIKLGLYLGVALFSLNSLSHSNDDSTTVTSSISSNKNAINWIENNLTPLHSLETRVNRLSIPQIMLQDKIPGLSIAFVDNGKVAWTQSYGYANLATSEKVTEKTVFTGASLSKPLTAIAALKLVESKKLSLDNNVNDFLKGWNIPENEFTKTEKVTLRRLIGHSAGIKNDLWSSYLPDETVPTLNQMLAGLSPSIDPATSVISVPGSEVKYSNPGYSIVQKILIDTNNKKFEDILDETVLKPSGMLDSSFQQPIPQKLQERRATGYDKNLVAYPYRLFPYKAAGGVWTTPTDMANFTIALLEDLDGKKNILSPAMAKQVFSRDNERLAFSKIYDKEKNKLIFRHYGSNQGFTCYLIGSLDKKQAVVIMTNSDNGFSSLDFIARAVAEYYQWGVLEPSIEKAYLPTISNIKEYQGQFNNNATILTFKVIENTLMLQSDENNSSIQLVAVNPNAFISMDDSSKYEFYRPRGSDAGAFKWVKVTTPSGSFNFAERITE